MRHRITASRIALAHRCSWWARPDVELPTSEASRAALLGTALHEAAENEAEEIDEERVDATFRRAVGVPQPEILAAVSEGLRESERRHLALLVESWLDWWRQLEAEVGLDLPRREVAYAIDVDAGMARRLESAEHRDYSTCTDREVPGTLDLVIRLIPNASGTSGITLRVLDYKTGQGPHRCADHEEQLRWQAAAVALERGERVVAGILHITQDEAREDWGVEVDGFGALIVVEELRALLDELPRAEPRPGLHCEQMYCPARAVCPATRALLIAAEVPLDHRRRLPIVGPIQSAEQALAILVAGDLLEQWLEDRAKAVRAWADEHGGVQAPDGRVWRGREVERLTPRLDAEGGLEALRAALGADADKAIATKVSTSWERIEVALRGRQERERAASGRKPAMKYLIEEVREKLKSAGALKRSAFTQYKWEQPKAASKE